MKRITVRLKGRPYDIVIGRGVLKNTGALLKGLRIGRDAVIVTNSRLKRLFGGVLKRSLVRNSFTAHFETVPDSEKAKSSAVAMNLIARIAEYDSRKDVFVIALGGGVVGDLAGFAASIYKRGVNLVQIPTTLLAQVDSAIGGKTAIDLPAAKNMAGVFYQPRIVISDITLVSRLAKRQLKNGLAEIIKYGVIKDKRLFEFLESEYKKILSCNENALEFVVERSSRIKARIVEEDEFDKKGSRVILNFGHTIGHAIEAATSYSGRYSHGEAVAAGMVAASGIALKLKMIRIDEAERIIRLIKRCGLPTAVSGLNSSNIYRSLLHDKKFVGRFNRFVLPAAIGRVKTVRGVPEGIVKKAIGTILIK